MNVYKIEITIFVILENHHNGCFFKFGVEESIMNAPPDYNSDQLFKSNPTFCVFLIYNLKTQCF
jgi:hypothetical protein